MIKRVTKQLAISRTLASSLAAVILLSSVGDAKAQQRELKYRERISGTAAPSSFDINGDGIPAHYVTFAGWSTLGLVNGGLLVEYDFPNLGPDPACSGGTLRLPILASASNRALTVRALALPGGQVFMRDDASTALFCLDPGTGSFTMSLQGNFIGGMGMLEGASGDYAYQGSGQVLLQDFVGEGDPVPLPFGGFTLETEGMLVLPTGSGR